MSISETVKQWGVTLEKARNQNPMELLGKQEYFECDDCEDTGIVSEGRYDDLIERKCHCE